MGAKAKAKSQEPRDESQEARAKQARPNRGIVRPISAKKISGIVRALTERSEKQY
jgi:hypothetical protein